MIKVFTIFFLVGLIIYGFNVKSQSDQKKNNVTEKDKPVIGTAIGNKAPELKLKNPDGKEIALSSLKGKMVLIHFWASWCGGPCRIDNQNVVTAYKKYKDKKFANGNGFTVYSVSLDTSAYQWKKAIEQYGLIWPTHVSDLLFTNSEAVKLYNGVMEKGIPTNWLIDGDGIIVASNLRNEALERAIEASDVRINSTSLIFTEGDGITWVQSILKYTGDIKNTKGLIIGKVTNTGNTNHKVEVNGKMRLKTVKTKNEILSGTTVTESFDELSASNYFDLYPGESRIFAMSYLFSELIKTDDIGIVSITRKTTVDPEYKQITVNLYEGQITTERKNEQEKLLSDVMKGDFFTRKGSIWEDSYKGCWQCEVNDIKYDETVGDIMYYKVNLRTIDWKVKERIYFSNGKWFVTTHP